MTRRTAKRLILTVCAIGFLACVVDIARGEEPPKHGRLWKASVLALAGASAADYASSLGHLESNGLLASRNGTFSPARGLAWKLGPTSAFLVGQSRDRKRQRLYAIINFAMAGVYSGVAVYNRRQR